MSLFDKVFGGKKAVIANDEEAFMGLMLAAMTADEDVSEVESRRLAESLRRMRLYQDWTEEAYQAASTKLLHLLTQGQYDYFVEACAEILSLDLHDTAFAMACDLILADGVIAEAEQKTMDLFQDRLHLDDDLVLKIVEVMVLKNKG